MSGATYQLIVEKTLCSSMALPNSNTVHIKLQHCVILYHLHKSHAFW